MTIEDIITLGKMGYTKDDISALVTTNATSIVETPVDNVETPVDNVETPAVNVDRSADILSAIETLTRTIQASNVASAQMGTLNKMTSDDVIANIITGGKNA